MKIKSILFILSIIFFTESSYSQVMLSGQLVDYNTFKAIPNVEIFKNGELATHTDDNGIYYLILEKTNYKIRFVYQNKTLLDTVFQFKEEKKNNINFCRLFPVFTEEVIMYDTFLVKKSVLLIPSYMELKNGKVNFKGTKGDDNLLNANGHIEITDKKNDRILDYNGSVMNGRIVEGTISYQYTSGNKITEKGRWDKYQLCGKAERLTYNYDTLKKTEIGYFVKGNIWGNGEIVYNSTNSIKSFYGINAKKFGYDSNNSYRFYINDINCATSVTDIFKPIEKTVGNINFTGNKHCFKITRAMNMSYLGNDILMVGCSFFKNSYCIDLKNEFQFIVPTQSNDLLYKNDSYCYFSKSGELSLQILGIGDEMSLKRSMHAFGNINKPDNTGFYFANGYILYRAFPDEKSIIEVKNYNNEQLNYFTTYDRVVDFFTAEKYPFIILAIEKFGKIELSRLSLFKDSVPHVITTLPITDQIHLVRDTLYIISNEGDNLTLKKMNLHGMLLSFEETKNEFTAYNNPISYDTERFFGKYKSTVSFDGQSLVIYSLNKINLYNIKNGFEIIKRYNFSPYMEHPAADSQGVYDGIISVAIINFKNLAMIYAPTNNPAHHILSFINTDLPLTAHQILYKSEEKTYSDIREIKETNAKLYFPQKNDFADIIWEGEVKNGLANGIGKAFTYKQAYASYMGKREIFNGNAIDGRPNGLCTYYNIDNGLTTEGLFIKGKRDGLFNQSTGYGYMSSNAITEYNNDLVTNYKPIEILQSDIFVRPGDGYDIWEWGTNLNASFNWVGKKFNVFVGGYIKNNTNREVVVEVISFLETLETQTVLFFIDDTDKEIITNSSYVKLKPFETSKFIVLHPNLSEGEIMDKFIGIAKSMEIAGHKNLLRVDFSSNRKTEINKHSNLLSTFIKNGNVSVSADFLLYDDKAELNVYFPDYSNNDVECYLYDSNHSFIKKVKSEDSMGKKAHFFDLNPHREYIVSVSGKEYTVFVKGGVNQMFIKKDNSFDINYQNP